MRVLHLLDHSIPHQTGYSARTLRILKSQRLAGFETIHLTSPKQESGELREETVDGWHFFRTPPAAGLISNVPGLAEIELIGETAHRLEQLVKRLRPHILYAHSPALNGIPALRVARRAGPSLVYDIHAWWEEASAARGTTRAGGLRYRLTRALESYVFNRADAVVVASERLQRDVLDRGVPLDKVTVITALPEDDGELKAAEAYRIIFNRISPQGAT